MVTKPKLFGSDRRGRRASGFTMLEAVAALIIIGVLTAFAIPRMASSAESQRRAELDDLIAAIRLVQTQSMNTVSPWSIQINSNSFVTARSGTNTALPGRSSATVNFSKLAVTAGVAAIAFDAWGNPGENNATITTNAGSFCVHKVTGYVQTPSCT
jgi:type II secretory pathway pseudopilin PulG